MFAGVHEQKLILRLPSVRREALIAAGAALPFVVMGRSMREYVAVAEASGAEEAVLRGLVGEAFGYASSLPPKVSKPRLRRGAARG